MNEREVSRWMKVGFVVFATSTVILCGQTTEHLNYPSQMLSNQAPSFAFSVGQALFLPICLVIFCFTMDALSIGLKRSSWSAWGGFGFASLVFLCQGLILLLSIQHAPLLLVVVGATPWLARRTFPIDAPQITAISAPPIA